MTATAVEMLVQVPADGSETLIVVRQSGAPALRYLGTMDREALIRTAGLFLQAAIGEDAFAMLRATLEVGGEGADGDEMPAVWDVVQAWTPPVEAVTS